jgi:hypothetical protein
MPLMLLLLPLPLPMPLMPPPSSLLLRGVRPLNCGDPPHLLHLFLNDLATSPRVAYTTKFCTMYMNLQEKAMVLNWNCFIHLHTCKHYRLLHTTQVTAMAKLKSPFQGFNAKTQIALTISTIIICLGALIFKCIIAQT